MDLQRASWWSSWWLRISNFVWLGVGAWEYHVILIAIIVGRGDQHWWAMLHDPDGRCYHTKACLHTVKRGHWVVLSQSTSL